MDPNFSKTVYTCCVVLNDKFVAGLIGSGGLPIRQSRQLPKARQGAKAYNFSVKNKHTYRLRLYWLSSSTTLSPMTAHIICC